MTGGSQQLRRFRIAVRAGTTCEEAATIAGITLGEAKLIFAEDAKNPPPPEAYVLLGEEPVSEPEQFDALDVFGYRKILADPPWNFEGGGNRNARTHYPTMSVEEIMALPVGDIAAPDCALFLWTTDPFLSAAIDTMRHWGFRYVSVAFHWAKQNKTGNGFFLGTGYGTRANVETCLFGTMGSMGLPADRGVRRLIVEPVREHSRKPDRVHDDIDRLYPGGRAIELFARTRRAGWDAWGNDVDRFTGG
jgi:N6-adenosine-specific RNA methylase IME4